MEIGDWLVASHQSPTHFEKYPQIIYYYCHVGKHSHPLEVFELTDAFDELVFVCIFPFLVFL